MHGRINNELAELTANPPGNCAVSLLGNNIAEWRVNFLGPIDSLYEWGSFEVILAIPTDYPLAPPDIAFSTKIYHPNVNPLNGALCEELYKAHWTPTKTIRSIIELILTLMHQPSAEFVVQKDVFRQYTENYEEFARVAKQWVDLYAR